MGICKKHCPNCNSTNYIICKHGNEFLCTDCKKKFAWNDEIHKFLIID